jgi:L-ascorbate metabolism protein UlaG (beta-lactamase superfamily)
MIWPFGAVLGIHGCPLHDVLGLPTGGPWLKVSDVVDFLRLVAPRVALPIHERSQSRPQVHYTIVKNLAPDSTEVRVPDLGTAMRI